MMTKGAAYQSDALDEALKSRLAVAGVIFADAPHALRDCSVVGAIFNERGDLYDADGHTIQNSARQLSAAGIPLHPDTKFYFYNILEPIRCDFLRRRQTGKQPTELLLVCGVAGGKGGKDETNYQCLHPNQRRAYKNFNDMYNDYSAGFASERLVTISRLQQDRAWLSAAQASGAKIVITRGPDGIDAINSHDFEGGVYRTLIDTRELFARENTIIGGGLGILVHGDYLEAHRMTMPDVLDRNTLPGQRITDVLNGKSFERPVPAPRPTVQDLLRQFGLERIPSS